MGIRLTVIAALTAVVAGGATLGVAGAAKPDSANCWGVVTSQRAVAAGDVGEHSSAQDEPRAGLGNVARTILGEDAHVSDLGTALAGLDDLPETECP